MKKDLLCVIQGPVGTLSGYGAHARDITRALIKAYPEWNIKIVDTRWGSTPRNYLTPGKDDDIISRILLSPINQQPDVYIPILIPTEFKPMGKFNIGITAGIETNLSSPTWLQGLNQMHLNIVPSNHAKQVFEQTKYDQKNSQGIVVNQIANIKPIEVLFEGIDTNIYKKTELINQSVKDIMNQVNEDFAFLVVGHWLQGALGHDRKDIGMTIKTFCETFRMLPKKPALVLKTSVGTLSVKDRAKIMQMIQYIRNDDKLPNVYLIHGNMTDEEMNSLYNHSKIKAMVSFTHGEGYGRPLAEFAVTKKPIIVSGWSGHLDFLKPEYSTLLPGEIKTVHETALQKDIIMPESKWFYVDYFTAGRIMKDVYKNYNKYFKLAKKQAEIVWKHYTFDKMTNKLKIILDKYLPTFPEEVMIDPSKLNLPKLSKLNKKD